MRPAGGMSVSGQKPRTFSALVPYRVRLWWAFRKAPVCNCAWTECAPWLHDPMCPVRDLDDGERGGGVS